MIDDTQKLIEQAYLEVTEELTEKYLKFIQDSLNEPEEWVGVSQNTLCRWLVSGIAK